jgi:hypothetical protein
MSLIITLLLFFQTSDTLSKAYDAKWEASEGFGQDSSIIQWFSSNELVFVVGAVSLIIWIGILYYLIRIEKKLNLLEKDQN